MEIMLNPLKCPKRKPEFMEIYFICINIFT